MNRTASPFPLLGGWRPGGGERQLRMRARGTTGSVAGAANYNSGLTAHSVSTACPSWFSRSPTSPPRKRMGSRRFAIFMLARDNVLIADDPGEHRSEEHTSELQ